MAYSAGKRSTGLAIASGIETQVDGSKLIREDLAVNGNITANGSSFNGGKNQNEITSLLCLCENL